MHRIKLTGDMTCTEAFNDAVEMGLDPDYVDCPSPRQMRYAAKLSRKTRQVADLLARGESYMARKTKAELGDM